MLPKKHATPIYTKTGDDGNTGMLFGGRIPKSDPRLEAYGTIGEAIAALGIARATVADERLAGIILELQRGLVVAEKELSGNSRSPDQKAEELAQVSQAMTADLESKIDELAGDESVDSDSVIPGANLESAAIDLARSILRRSERRLVAANRGGTTVAPAVMAYLNRASDLLYVVARESAGPGEQVSDG